MDVKYGSPTCNQIKPLETKDILYEVLSLLDSLDRVLGVVESRASSLEHGESPEKGCDPSAPQVICVRKVLERTAGELTVAVSRLENVDKILVELMRPR